MGGVVCVRGVSVFQTGYKNCKFMQKMEVVGACLAPGNDV